MITHIKHRQVGPRDGLQFERVVVPIEDRLIFIDKLVESGETFIEAGSFVREDKVPSMAGSNEVARQIKERVREGGYPGVTFSFLTLNGEGARQALEIVDENFGELAVVVAASDAFCKANMGVENMEAAFVQLVDPVMQQAKAKNVKVRGYVSTVFEGQQQEPIDPDRVAEAAKRLLAEGAYEVSLGDTTGAGTPEKVEALVAALNRAGVPLEKIAMHFHDTHGNAVENAAKSMELGIQTFDSAAGGLGGCPFARSPKGNLATESLVAYCEQHGITTGIDMERLVQASHFILDKVGKPSPSAAHNAVAARLGLPKIQLKEPTPPPVRIKPDGSYPSKALNISIDARGVAQVALNRPKVNAFDPDLIQELTETFQKMEKDNRIKAVVFSGEGKVFSAGANLQWMGEMAGFSYEENVADAGRLALMFETMHQFSKPLIGRIHGAAMGGGVGLTAVCDTAIAAEGTKFAFTEVRLGLRPSTISSYCIPKLGVENAKTLFQTGEDFLAADAQRYGLVDSVAPLEKLDVRVEEEVQIALREGKAALRKRSEEGRLNRAVVEADEVPQDEKIIALIEGVTKRLQDQSPEGREALMQFTANDIAQARCNPDARRKITAFLEASTQQTGKQ